MIEDAGKRATMIGNTRISALGWIAVLLAFVMVCGTADARQRKKNRKPAVRIMKVGETEVYDLRQFKAPRIENPSIVKLKMDKGRRSFSLTARKRGVTYLTFKVSPLPGGRKRGVRLKIVVR